MKKRTRLLSGLVALLLVLGLISTASAAFAYRIPITLANTSATAYTDFVAFATVPNQTLIDNGFITSATAFDTQVQEGTIARPYLPRGTTLGMYVPTLGAHETRQFDYYLGYDSPQTAFNFMAGGDGYIYTADSDSLEPVANNFEVEWKGYFDATKTGDILAKGAEYGIISSTGGQIRGFVGSTTSTYTEVIPNAVGYISDWAITGASTAWEAIDDPIGVPDTSTYIATTANSPGYRTSVNIVNPMGGLAGGTITSVDVYFRALYIDGTYHGSSITPFLRLNGVNQSSSAQTLTTSWATYNKTVTRPGGGTWTREDLLNLEAGIEGPSPSNDDARVTQLYVRVNYTPPATGISAVTVSGIHTFKITKTSTTLELFVDAVSKGTATVGNPSNTGSVVISSHNGPATYTEYSEITIGTQKLWYQPITVQGDTITDRSPIGTNTGTIVWGNSSPSGDIGITVGTLVPSTEVSYLGEDRNEPEVLPVMTPAPDIFTTNEPVNVPGYGVWKAFAGISSNAPLTIFWILVPALVLFTLGIGALAFKFTRQLWVMVLVMVFCLAMGTAMDIINMWAPIIVGIVGFTLVAVKSWVFQ